MKKKETLWFTHDYLDDEDLRIVKLMAHTGMEGYGRFWKLLSFLRSREDFKYDVTEEFAYELIAMKLYCTADEAEQFINDCIAKYKLMQTDGSCIWSDFLLAKLAPMQEKKALLSEMGKKGAEVKKEKKATLAKTEATLTDTEAQYTTQEKKKLNNIPTTTNNKPIYELAGEGLVLNEGNREPIARTTVAGTKAMPDKETIAQTWERYRQNVLADEQFVLLYDRQRHIKKDYLGRWLLAFHKLLEFNAEPIKSECEYRKHFGNWFKFRNIRTESPETYVPVQDYKNHPRAVSSYKAPPPTEQEMRERQKLREQTAVQEPPKEQPAVFSINQKRIPRKHIATANTQVAAEQSPAQSIALPNPYKPGTAEHFEHGLKVCQELDELNHGKSPEIQQQYDELRRLHRSADKS